MRKWKLFPSTRATMCLFTFFLCVFVPAEYWVDSYWADGGGGALVSG